jgi:hypothetical protein
VKDKGQSNDDFQKAIRRLQKRGEVHIQRMMRAGETKPYRYSMVMDADTVSEWRSVLRLIEYAVANPSHGIFQCALSLDDSAPGQTWFMWAESLRQASNVNLPKAHWTIFQRHGFYGKGLFDNEMMIKSVIGIRPKKQPDGTYQALEALPVDIMSHDTFEAKILKPCFVSEVLLREEPAKNALSSFPQTTRWMLERCGTHLTRRASSASGSPSHSGCTACSTSMHPGLLSCDSTTSLLLGVPITSRTSRSASCTPGRLSCSSSC